MEDARCCNARIAHREARFSVCLNGHFTRTEDGKVLPWRTTFRGHVYDENDRRLLLQLTMKFAPVADVSDDAILRARRTEPIGGRPKTARSDTIQELAEAARAVMDQLERNPTIPLIAEVLVVDVETVRSRMRRAEPKITMPQVKAAARELPPSAP